MSSSSPPLRSQGLVAILRSASPRDLNTLLRRCGDGSAAPSRRAGPLLPWVYGVKLMQGALHLNVIPSSQSYRRVVDLLGRHTDASTALNVVTNMASSPHSRRALTRFLVSSFAEHQPTECLALLLLCHHHASRGISEGPHLAQEPRLYRHLCTALLSVPQSGQWASVLEMLPLLQRDRVPPSDTLCAGVLLASSRGKRWDVALRVMAMSDAAGMALSAASSALALRCFFSDGAPWRAALDWISSRRGVASLDTERRHTSVLLVGAALRARFGRWAEATELFSSALRSDGESPDSLSQLDEEECGILGTHVVPRLDWHEALLCALRVAAISTAAIDGGRSGDEGASVVDARRHHQPPPHQLWRLAVPALARVPHNAATATAAVRVLRGGLAVDAGRSRLPSPAAPWSAELCGTVVHKFHKRPNGPLWKEALALVWAHCSQAYHREGVPDSLAVDVALWLSSLGAQNRAGAIIEWAHREAITLLRGCKDRESVLRYCSSPEGTLWSACLEQFGVPERIAGVLAKRGAWEAAIAIGALHVAELEEWLTTRGMWEAALAYTVSASSTLPQRPAGREVPRRLYIPRIARQVAAPLCAQAGRYAEVVELFESSDSAGADTDSAVFLAALGHVTEAAVRKSFCNGASGLASAMASVRRFASAAYPREDVARELPLSLACLNQLAVLLYESAAPPVEDVEFITETALRWYPPSLADCPWPPALLQLLVFAKGRKGGCVHPQVAGPQCTRALLERFGVPEALLEPCTNDGGLCLLALVRGFADTTVSATETLDAAAVLRRTHLAILWAVAVCQPDSSTCQSQGSAVDNHLATFPALGHAICGWIECMCAAGERWEGDWPAVLRRLLCRLQNAAHTQADVEMIDRVYTALLSQREGESGNVDNDTIAEAARFATHVLETSLGAPSASLLDAIGTHLKQRLNSTAAAGEFPLAHGLLGRLMRAVLADHLSTITLVEGAARFALHRSEWSVALDWLQQAVYFGGRSSGGSRSEGLLTLATAECALSTYLVQQSSNTAAPLSASAAADSIIPNWERATLRELSTNPSGWRRALRDLQRITSSGAAEASAAAKPGVLQECSVSGVVLRRLLFAVAKDTRSAASTQNVLRHMETRFGFSCTAMDLQFLFRCITSNSADIDALRGGLDLLVLRCERFQSAAPTRAERRAVLRCSCDGRHDTYTVRRAVQILTSILRSRAIGDLQEWIESTEAAAATPPALAVESCPPCSSAMGGSTSGQQYVHDAMTPVSHTGDHQRAVPAPPAGWRSPWTPQQLAKLGSLLPALEEACTRGTQHLLVAAEDIARTVFRDAVPASAVVEAWNDEKMRRRLLRLSRTSLPSAEMLETEDVEVGTGLAGEVATDSDLGAQRFGAAEIPPLHDVPADVVRFVQRHLLWLRFGSVRRIQRDIEMELSQGSAESWPIDRLRTLANVNRKAFRVAISTGLEGSVVGIETERDVADLRLDFFARLSPFVQFLAVTDDSHKGCTRGTMQQRRAALSAVCQSVLHGAMNVAQFERAWPLLANTALSVDASRWPSDQEAELTEAAIAADGVLPLLLTSRPSATHEEIASYWATFACILAPGASLHEWELSHLAAVFYRRLDEARHSPLELNALADEIAASCFSADRSRRPCSSFLYHTGADIASVWHRARATLADRFRSHVASYQSAATLVSAAITSEPPRAYHITIHTSGVSVSTHGETRPHVQPVVALRWHSALALLSLCTSKPLATEDISCICAFARVALRDGLSQAAVRNLVKEIRGPVEDAYWRCVDGRLQVPEAEASLELSRLLQVVHDLPLPARRFVLSCMQHRQRHPDRTDCSPTTDERESFLDWLRSDCTIRHRRVLQSLLSPTAPHHLLVGLSEDERHLIMTLLWSK